MASELHLNDAVIITASDDELNGTVAHLGPVQFAPGSDWIGIKLTDTSIGKGKNNGTVKGLFYFDAGGENNGMFVRRANVRKIVSEESPRKSGLKSPSPRMTSPFGRSASSASNEVATSSESKIKSPATSAAAASRENFLRRLEQHQEKTKEVTDKVKNNECTDGDAKAVILADLMNDEAAAVDANRVDETKPMVEAPTKVSEEMKLASTSATACEKEELSTHSGMPRGNQECMAKVTAFLSTQSNLTRDQSSLNWLNDMDDSSLIFLKELAFGENSQSSDAGVAHALLENDSSLDWVTDMDSSSLEYLKQLAVGASSSESKNIPAGTSPAAMPQPTAIASVGIQANNPDKSANVDILDQIAKATRSPQSLSNVSVSSPEKMSPLELRMLTMIENQNEQIQKMQTQLDVMNNIISQMGGDVRYLRDAQQRRDHNDRVAGNAVGSPYLRSVNAMDAAGYFPRPPPPPPLPPHGISTMPLAVNQNASNQQHPEAGAQEVDLPFQRGIFFPMFHFIFKSILSLITNFRSILFSTGPGRLYRHIRDRAIERRAFANVDLRGLIKLLVMLTIFTGRMERGGGERRNQRANNRRVQQNENNNGEGDASAYFARLLQTLMVSLRNHKVHVLVVASLFGFLVQTGVISFFYEVIWVEREELFNVWLGHRNEADARGENVEAEGVVQADRPPQNANDQQPADGAANNRAGAQVREEIQNAVRGLQNAGNNRNTNANVRRGGMIRRGANGGFFHDIYCLIFSFILSLIPAWKPEEADPPPGDETEQPGDQQQQAEVQQEDDGQNE